MLAIGSDHGGYELKEEIKKYLDEQKISYKDFGTDSAASVDYPDIAYPPSYAFLNISFVVTNPIIFLHLITDFPKPSICRFFSDAARLQILYAETDLPSSVLFQHRQLVHPYIKYLHHYAVW